MNINDFMKKSLVKKTIDKQPDFYYEFLEIRPRIVCKNGMSLSVQGSQNHYCSPRENYPFYSSVEVGYPSIRPPKEWKQYYDGEWQEMGVIGTIKRIFKDRNNILYNIKGMIKKENRHMNWYMLKCKYLNLSGNSINGVYGYVPVELVDNFISSNGGIDEKATFKNE